jgi:hypothetical protein
LRIHGRLISLRLEPELSFGTGSDRSRQSVGRQHPSLLRYCHCEEANPAVEFGPAVHIAGYFATERDKLAFLILTPGSLFGSLMTAEQAPQAARRQESSVSHQSRRAISTGSRSGFSLHPLLEVARIDSGAMLPQLLSRQAALAVFAQPRPILVPNPLRAYSASPRSRRILNKERLHDASSPRAVQ